MKDVQRNLGTNRGRPRLWLEKAVLTDAGIDHGMRIDVVAVPGALTIKVHPLGKRKVSGAPGRPVVDVVGRLIEEAFDVEQVGVVNVHKVRVGILRVTAYEGVE